jgi:hypothetical protein
MQFGVRREKRARKEDTGNEETGARTRRNGEKEKQAKERTQ